MFLWVVCISHVCFVGFSFILVYFLILFACLLSKENKMWKLDGLGGEEDLGGDDQNIWYEFYFQLRKRKNQ